MKKSYKIVLLPGDGIGNDVMREGEKILNLIPNLLDVKFEIEKIPCGGQFYLKHGTRDWPEDAEEKCKQADLIFLGAVGWPSPDGKGPVTMKDGKMAGYSPVIGNRVKLNLYANVRPVKCFKGILHKIHGIHQKVWDENKIDLIIVRENTEGLYTPTGGYLTKGEIPKLAIDTRVITREATEKVIRFSFELCKRKERGAPIDNKKRVTCITKDNVLWGCKLFTKIFYEIGEEYPEIEKDTAIVDAFTQWLIQKPEYYNVCVTPNMFGDIITDLAAVLQGGMGMAVGCNIGDEHAMFEPIHGSAPKHAGKDRANPMAMILAIKEGFLWLSQKNKDQQLKKIADSIEKAVAQVIEEGIYLTYDIIGEKKAKKCSQVGDMILKYLERTLQSE